MVEGVIKHHCSFGVVTAEEDTLIVSDNILQQTLSITELMIFERYVTH